MVASTVSDGNIGRERKVSGEETGALQGKGAFTTNHTKRNGKMRIAEAAIDARSLVGMWQGLFLSG